MEDQEEELTQTDNEGAFIGKSNDYYLPKWKKASWSWLPFLLGTLRMGYHKMYKAMFPLLAIFFVMDIIVYGFSPGGSAIGFVIILGAVGSFANRLYRDEALRKINKVGKLDYYHWNDLQRKQPIRAIRPLAEFLWLMVSFILFTSRSLQLLKQEYFKGVA